MQRIQAHTIHYYMEYLNKWTHIFESFHSEKKHILSTKAVCQMVCHFSIQGAKVMWNVSHDRYAFIKVYFS